MFSFLSREQVLGIIRHALTVAGGSLITNGYTDQATLEIIVGGIVATIGVVWSLTSKSKNKVGNKPR